MAILLGGDVVSSRLIQGEGAALIGGAVPALGDVVVGLAMFPGGDIPDGATYGGQAMTLLDDGTDGYDAWYLYWRLVDGSEAGSTFYLTQNGPISSFIAGIVAFTGGNTVRGTVDNAIYIYQPAIPANLTVTPNETSFGLYIFSADNGIVGGASLAISTPSGHTLLDTHIKSSSAMRQTAIMTCLDSAAAATAVVSHPAPTYDQYGMAYAAVASIVVSLAIPESWEVSTLSRWKFKEMPYHLHRGMTKDVHE